MNEKRNLASHLKGFHQYINFDATLTLYNFNFFMLL